MGAAAVMEGERLEGARFAGTGLVPETGWTGSNLVNQGMAEAPGEKLDARGLNFGSGRFSFKHPP